ncbi:MAG: NAD+ synthase [Phycisphaerales bacterium]|nr:NAD+ synthase [Phycisphaerales bacterium]
MRLGLLQLNPMVGDLQGNLEETLLRARAAADAGAQIVVGGELGLLGYPPRDLLLREGVVESCEHAARRLAAELPEGLVALVGSPRRTEDGSLRNSIGLCRNGVLEQWFDKRLLPTYDVFDELRHFTPGSAPVHFEHLGRRIGVLICEDLWRAEDVSFERGYHEDPVDAVRSAGCDLLLVSSASPFMLGKRTRHLGRLESVARDLGADVVAVNQVGGNDDVVFAGNSMVVASDGALRHESPAWSSDVSVVDLEGTTLRTPPGPEPEEELFHALRFGLADYCRKTGQRSLLLGLSGGIDSAVVATIAAAALGPENVTGVLMPSRYSSESSLVDARELAENLGLAAAVELEIEQLHQDVRDRLHPVLGDFGGIADENVQARLRGLLLMTISNDTGAMVLPTGNKSEMAVGYCTLYGDMCGGVAVIGDVLKTEVWALSRWLNLNHERVGLPRPPIPVSSIEKPPSAELRPDQKDSDSLPPYEELDAIIRLRVEEELSLATIVERTGLDAATVRHWVELLDRNEYKRHQAAIVLKVSPRTFGRGRPMPMALRWTPLSG